MPDLLRIRKRGANFICFQLAVPLSMRNSFALPTCRESVTSLPRIVKTLHQTNYTARREEMLGKCIKGPIFIALGHSNLSFFITAYLVESWFKLSRRRLKCWIVEPCIPVSVRQPIIDCTIQPRSHPSLQLIRRHPGTIGQIFQQITGSHLYPSIPSSVLKPSN